MDTYRVPIASILDDLGATIEVTDTLGFASLEVGAERFVALEPARFQATLTNTGTGIIAMGSVSAPVSATCARCLCEFPTVIEARFDAYFVRPGHEEGVPEEQEIEYIDAENNVDILPAIMAALVLEAPFAPLHDEECAGMCVECGADLNEGPCGCPEHVEAGHPFAALGSLLADEPGPVGDDSKGTGE